MAPPLEHQSAPSSQHQSASSARSTKEGDKEAGNPPPLPDGWTRCHAYMERKKRFCRQEVAVERARDLVDKSGEVALEKDAADAKNAADAGPRYCGNHQHLLPSDGSTSKKRKLNRIPCPIDPSHSILEDSVEKHILICPQTKKLRLQKEQAFYQHDMNTGGHGSVVGVTATTTSTTSEKKDMSENSSSTSSGSGGALESQMERLEWAKRVALCVLYVHQYLFTGSGPAASVASALSRDDIHNAVSLHDLSEPEFQAGLCESVAGYRIKSGGPRHLHQQASLVGHLRRIGALGRTAAATTTTTAGQPPPRTFLEVGAGRGMMGLVAAGVEAADVADALANNATSSTNNNGIMEKDTTRLILVERAGSRGKADTVLRQASGNSSASSAYMKLETVQWTRIQCDLAHVDTRAILMDKPQQQDETAKVRNTTTTAAAITPTSTTATTPADTRQLVVIAKHLCGAGTDLALKSLEPIKDQVSACVMATCCHGACSWDHYVGRDFLCQAMKEGNPSVDFGRVEFELLRRWSAGTVMTANSCKNDNNTSSGDKEEVDEHNNNRSEAGEMQSTEDSTSDAFDGVGVSAVVEALQLNCHVQGLGRACQRLIDYGRREYLRKVLFASTPGQSGSAELLYYVPDDITPQNAALVAHR